MPSRPAPAMRAALAGLVILLATAIAACSPREDGDATPTTAATAGLVVLSGVPGEATLTIHDERGTARTVDPPDPQTAWISAGRRGNLLATLADGTLRLSDRITTDATPGWSEVPDEDAELPPEPLYFATWSPNGASAAALAADFGAESRLTLTIVDPYDSATLLLPIPRRPQVAPPIWLDDDRVLLDTMVGLAIVDTAAGGAIAAGPEPGTAERRPLDVSADRSVVAITDLEGRAIEIRELARWLAGDVQEPLATIPVDGEPGAVAFDRRGSRVAVVWSRPQGGGTVVVYRRDDGWQPAARFDLPGDSSRGVVDWLP